ncbi:MAG: cytochrome c biogenesis protein CcsA [Gammaproteobacteria bacterium]
MPAVAIGFATIFFYAAAAGLLWWRAGSARMGGAVVLRVLTAAAVCLHGLELYRAAYAGGAVNLALGNAVSLVAWMTVALFLAASLAKEILNLGLVVLPSGLAGFITGWLLPGERFLLESFPAGIGRHLLIALPAYGVLSIAFAQALILWLQERQLRKPNPGGFFPQLPALETMESNLFYLTLLGFVLLSADLVTGMLNTRQNHGRLLLFNHHIIFALGAWAGFGGLLLGRKIFGWRGRTTAGWTMTAFAVLALAYFGTRFVSGVILQRG